MALFSCVDADRCGGGSSCLKLTCIVVFFCFGFGFVSTVNTTTSGDPANHHTHMCRLTNRQFIIIIWKEAINQIRSAAIWRCSCEFIIYAFIHCWDCVFSVWACYDDASYGEVNQLKTLFIYVHVEWCRLSMEMKIGENGRPLDIVSILWPLNGSSGGGDIFFLRRIPLPISFLCALDLLIEWFRRRFI